MEEKPPEVEAYEKTLGLNVIGWEKTIPPGFKYEVWVLTVHDEGTSENVRIPMGYPYSEHHRYRLLRLRNKLGHVVTCLAFVEELPKAMVRVPTLSDVKTSL